jgi:putative iron-regulated protein
MTVLASAFLLGSTLFLVAGCGDSRREVPEGTSESRPLESSSEQELARTMALHYAEVLHAAYSDALRGAEELEVAVDEFCAAPSAAGLAACRQAWLKARPAYQQSEVGRFYDGPIDRSPDGPEPDLNPWPLDEAFIDAVEGDPSAGFINDPARALDEAALRALNGQGGEENIAAGWHAVEFMLWDQDRDPKGPGRRDFRDFLDEGPRPHADRRRRYLQTVTGMIVADLKRVTAAWDPKTGAFRQEFLARPIKETLRCMLTGAGTLALGELHGERMLVPYTSKGQEDEHSCFSDTTHLDHLHNLLGVRWVWTGRYESPRDGRRLEGPGFDALLRASGQSDRADRVLASLDAAEEAMRREAFAPFDQAILGADDRPGRRAILDAIRALKRFDGEVTRVARHLGLDIVTVLPG